MYVSRALLGQVESLYDSTRPNGMSWQHKMSLNLQ